MEKGGDAEEFAPSIVLFPHSCSVAGIFCKASGRLLVLSGLSGPLGGPLLGPSRQHV